MIRQISENISDFHEEHIAEPRRRENMREKYGADIVDWVEVDAEVERSKRREHEDTTEE